MTRALLIVDVQNDFTENGALAVVGGDAVAEGITRLLAERADDYAVILASRDWHDPDSDNGGHISATPDFVHTWPPHCIAGSTGAEYDPLLDVAAVTHHVRKGQGIPAYSLFEGITDDDHTAASVLTEHGVTDVDVVGIATDHCVLASAEDAIEHGLRVRVFTDLVAGVAPGPSASALAELAHRGAVIEQFRTELDGQKAGS